MALKNNIVGILLLALVSGTYAMSLGEIRGAAWIGQPLDLHVPLQLDEEVGSESLCLEAEVIYGDFQQASGRVRVSLEPRPKTAVTTVRIQSLNPVNELVVTVNLKAGCQAKTTRRYVLLVDVPANLERSISTVSGVEGIMPAAAVTADRDGAKTDPLVRTPSSTLRKRSVGQKHATPADKASKLSVRRVDKPQARKSRLSLDPLDPLELRFERIQPEYPAHSLPIQMPVLPADVPPEGLEVARQGEQFKKLETDLLSMQSQLAKSEQGMSQLRSRLKEAESERYGNKLVYALATLLMGAVLSLAYLMRRLSMAQSSASDAWHQSVHAVNGTPGQTLDDRPDVSEPSSTTHETSQTASHTALDIDLDNLIVEPEYEAAESIEGVAAPQSNNTLDFDLPVQGNPTAVDPNESKLQFNKPGVQVDPRQHADFLVSLGQSDQAIKILNTAINLDEKISPMVYLDLLKIYHAMGMRDDYRLLSEKFNRLFKARVPDYARFRNEGRDLTTYEAALTQICFYWASPQAVEVIDTFIYADQKDPSSDDVFDLQAFRELLLLRAVALNKLEVPQVQGRSARKMNSVIWQG